MSTITDLPALSIRQPWATSILNGKDVENRDWPTRYRGRFLIHAAKTMTQADVEAWRIFCASSIPEAAMTWARGQKVGDLPRGGIVGIATLVDCVTRSDSPWFCGTYGFVLADVQPLPFVPCRGMLGFFRPDLGGFNNQDQP